jgi:hypothetical protein
MKIYIIEANQGEYADRQMWIAKVVSSEKKAEQITNDLNKTVEQITDKYDELRTELVRWQPDLPEWKELFEDLPDPMLEHNWSGCEYFWYAMRVE